jgi:3-methyl-2-oxobutanoate hydroxymethyltransferase
VDLTKVTPAIIRSMKTHGQKIASLTTYDYPTTRLLDETGIPLLLVGDSLGMVILGYADTTSVTMQEMEHHVRAAARARPRALLAADLPYRSYETATAAVQNSARLVSAGAEAVKAEGGRLLLEQAKAIVAAGIPFIGHLGMLPQSIREEGRYRIKGKSDQEREDLLADASALAEAGAFAIVLELVTSPVAKEITANIPIPTIGIGSGPDCDGQILVTHDLIGTFPWFTPKFVKPRLQSAALMRTAVEDWMKSL